ncbi:hypothetical protein T439DRAFT_328563 [Meredithblackwellia eburnea MCA 4105]
MTPLTGLSTASTVERPQPTNASRSTSHSVTDDLRLLIDGYPARLIPPNLLAHLIKAAWDDNAEPQWCMDWENLFTSVPISVWDKVSEQYHEDTLTVNNVELSGDVRAKARDRSIQIVNDCLGYQRFTSGSASGKRANPPSSPLSRTALEQARVRYVSQEKYQGGIRRFQDIMTRLQWFGPSELSTLAQRQDRAAKTNSVHRMHSTGILLEPEADPYDKKNC